MPSADSKSSRLGVWQITQSHQAYGLDRSPSRCKTSERRFSGIVTRVGIPPEMPNSFRKSIPESNAAASVTYLGLVEAGLGVSLRVDEHRTATSLIKRRQPQCLVLHVLEVRRCPIDPLSSLLVRRSVGQIAHDAVFQLVVAKVGAQGLIYSFPCVCKDGDWQIVQGAEINDFSRAKMAATEQELTEERDAVAHLLP